MTHRSSSTHVLGTDAAADIPIRIDTGGYRLDGRRTEAIRPGQDNSGRELSVFVVVDDHPPAAMFINIEGIGDGDDAVIELHDVATARRLAEAIRVSAIDLEALQDQETTA
jgi:hypothetical protein